MEATLTLPQSQPLYSAEDLLLFRDGPRYELLDGRLKEKMMGAKASGICLELMISIGNYIRSNHLATAFGSDAGYQMFPARPNRVRFPDGSVVCQGRLPNDEIPDGYIRLAPDLALEVVSPNDEAYEVEEKIEEYLQAGVRLIWVVYPSTKRVMVFRADGTVSRLKETDSISGEAVLPGFNCALADVLK